MPLLLAFGLVAAACTSGGEGPQPVPAAAPSVERMLRDLGTDTVRQMVRGYVPDRSGEIVIVPKPGSTVAQWPGGLRGPEDPRTTHAAPWDYLQRVPIVLYGPGLVRAGLVQDRPVDVTDIPATLSELLGFDWRAPDGEPLGEALAGGGRPKVLVVVAYDGGGWNVLERWPEAWPELRRLAAAGTTYTNATIGSAPPITAPIHANIGTGAYPREHGIAENTGRLPDGSLGELYFYEEDPRLLASETLADAWDRANGNRPWVGLLAYESWHLAMMGKGAQAAGGDRDIAALWDFRGEGGWFTNEEVYALPGYLPGEDGLAARLREIDVADGAEDGRWADVDITDDFFIPSTPGFVAYQGDALMELLRREPIGDDDVTDLLFVELKPSDNAGHLFNIESTRFEEVLRAQDDVLARLVAELDRRFPGEYALVYTADHGMAPRPDAAGGLRIDRFRLEREVEEHFGGDIIEAVHPDDVYLHAEALDELGVTALDVARVIADLRFRQVAPEGTDLEALGEEVAGTRVFAAALPGAVLDGLSEGEVEALGEGAYPEGDLTTPPNLSHLLRR